MLRTMTVQYGARPEGRVSAREFDPSVFALIERQPLTVRDTEPLSVAVEKLFGGQPCGVPVVTATGTYGGVCTMRSIASLCLLINGETAALMPSLGFLRDDMERIRERLGASLTMPAIQAADPFVPKIRPTATLPEIFFHFYRGHALLPVIEDETGGFVGTIGCDAVMRAVLGRPAPAGAR